MHAPAIVHRKFNVWLRCVRLDASHHRSQDRLFTIFKLMISCSQPLKESSKPLFRVSQEVEDGRYICPQL